MAVVTTLPGIKIACPHGEEEVRDVIKESYLNETPFYIRLYRNDKCNSIPNPDNKPYVIDGEFKSSYKKTLISIGEISTEMCRNIKQKVSEVNHIHLIYVDKVSIESYAKDLKQILQDSKIISVEEHRKTGSVSNLLLEILREDIKIFTPNDLYPHMGGSHMDILEQLDFTEDKLETLIREG